MRWTKGPWRRSAGAIFAGLDKDVRLIVELDLPLSPQDQGNLDLIAVAPELYDAAEAALQFIDSLAMPTGNWPVEVRNYLNAAAPKLRVALTKARGEDE